MALGWQTALAEAWEAYLQGSYPIGACVVDAAGNVIARGRNRLGEKKRVDGVISGHRLGHAEVNALLALPDLSAEECRALTLCTTVEPCPMCLGAMLMQRIGNLAYAAADVWAGHTDALQTTFYPSQKKVQVSRAPQDIVRACSVLHLTFFLDRGMPLDHGFLSTHAAKEPVFYAAAMRLHREGALLALRERQAPLSDALAVLAMPIEPGSAFEVRTG